MTGKNSRLIPVTKPSLGPLSEYVGFLEEIWDTGIMTHNGPFVQQLELVLQNYLDVKNVVCVSSGTTALQLAIRALDLSGEIITTPFSFIATANIISWEHCQPVFVDIDQDTWNMDPNKIEEAITPNTSAILPVHVFGTACTEFDIEYIAGKYNLRVIYDAAHAMSVNRGGKSILEAGAVSCVSFHATKLFTTGEGGACVTEDDDLADRIKRLRFFGFDKNKDIVDEGMNGKMTEISAALGLVNIKRLSRVLENRGEKYQLYVELLIDMPDLQFQKIDRGESNFSYMPICFQTEKMLIHVMTELNKNGIFPKRYFFPALHDLPIFDYRNKLSVVETISSTVVCLPLYDTLSEEDIRRICTIIKKAIGVFKQY